MTREQWWRVIGVLEAGEINEGETGRVQFDSRLYDIYWATFGRWIQRNMGA